MSERTSRAGLALLLVTLAVAAAWRLIGLAAEGLWVDEAYTALISQRSLPGILAQLREDDAPLLFYLLQSAFGRTLGADEVAVRLFPALCGLGTVIAGWACARRHAPAAAWAVAATLATSPLLVFYARQARNYSLVHLLAVLLLWATLEIGRGVTRKNALAFLLSALALLYSHNLGLLVAAAAALLAARPLLRGPVARTHGLPLLALAALGAVPWAIHLIANVGFHAETNAWMGAWWGAGRPLALAPLYSLATFAPGAAQLLRPPVPLPGWPAGSPAVWGALALCAAGLVAAGWGWWQTRARPGSTRAGHGVAATSEPATLIVAASWFSFLPLAGLVAVSLIVGPAYVLGRTDTVALPAFLILVAAGWSHLPRWFGRAAVLLACAAGLAGQPLPGTATEAAAKGSDRELARLLAQRAGPDAAIVCASLTRPTIEYYGRRLGYWDRAAWTGSFPALTDRNPAAVFALPLDSAAVWQEEAIALRERWERAGVERVFILATRSAPAATPTNAPASAPAGAPAGAPASAPADSRAAAWPRRPAIPPAGREQTAISAVAYPANVLLSALSGLHPVAVEAEYRQDWVSGERMLLRVDRAAWVPLDSIPRLEIQR